MKTLDSQAYLRYEDSAARLGGGEFVAAQAATRLERMRTTLAGTELQLESGDRVPLSGSFGIAD